VGGVVDGPANIGLIKRRPGAGKKDADQTLGRFVRLERWNELECGDVVKVAGHSARGRHWRFRAHVTNTSNGASWVEVSLVEGPPPSRRPAVATAEEEPPAPRVERVRSFAPELVTPRWKRRGRRATWLSADAPDSSSPVQQSMF
jgi:hypothetical protein